MRQFQAHELLTYLTEKLKLKFLVTSKLCQDPLENLLLAIIRQSFGSNGHPTLMQFLSIVNCLLLYGLINCISQGNCEHSTLASLLDVEYKGCVETEPSHITAEAATDARDDQPSVFNDH